ncbi:hypothetical protein H261_16523 [Paramagnetospirillum caucaseum]|uniref:Peptidase C14 caspase domain-containing protein n=1 Tax=Paramagnetospirillum caucaseum TaxID=1244869 RepID=M2ZNG0_9PROT|nr:hypothetical protein H261_16523 [Paramagnetospirillum caucaseum]
MRGLDGGPPGGGREFDRRQEFGDREFDRRGRPGFRPPPPPPLPPPRFERFGSPPHFPGTGGDFREGADNARDDPTNFVPPSWLKEWIANARQRGYGDEELATILSHHPRLGRFVQRSRERGFGDPAIFAAMGLDRWPAQPSHASVSPPPLPSPKSTTPAQPASASSTVRLEIADHLHTTEAEVELVGTLGGATKGASVFVDGAQVSVARNGTFSHRRGVPIGETEIKVEARDRQGRGTETMVTVTREPAAATGPYEPLNPSRAKGKRHAKAVALIIGIDRYESAPRAEYAENDANAFYDYATRALGVPSDRIKLLTGAKARRLSVEKAVLAWVQPLVAPGKSDVYVFFSGHGLASDDGRDQYLLPYDGDRALLAQSALKRKDVIDALVAAGARSVTLFLDTCYSGGTRGNDTLVQAARPILISVTEPDQPANVAILAAAGRDQLSSSLSGARHGLFSYYLMKGLEGEAATGDRSITTGSLETYLRQQVPGEAAKLDRRQSPELIGDPQRVLSEW